MLGAIIGDIVGSVYEWNRIKTKDFEFFTSRCFFTDDSVCTAAVADILLHDLPPAETMQKWCQRYPDCSSGGMFGEWIYEDTPEPYDSYGNGAAMRVSPAAFLHRDDLDAGLAASDTVTAITHNHPEGMKGARATTHAIWLALQGESSAAIRRVITNEYGYDLTQTVDEIRPEYSFNETCQGTVPQAITCALESVSFEDAVRNAISLGADADTLAAIAGPIAEALHGIPAEFIEKANNHYLADAPDICAVIQEMYQTFETRSQLFMETQSQNAVDPNTNQEYQIEFPAREVVRQAILNLDYPDEGLRVRDAVIKLAEKFDLSDEQKNAMNNSNLNVFRYNVVAPQFRYLLQKEKLVQPGGSKTPYFLAGSGNIPPELETDDNSTESRDVPSVETTIRVAADPTGKEYEIEIPAASVVKESLLGFEYPVAGIRIKDVAEILADEFTLTDEQRNAKYKYGLVWRFHVNVVANDLVNSEQLLRIKQGWIINPNQPEEVTPDETSSPGEDIPSPEVVMERKYQEIQNNLEAELLQKIKDNPPDFFEQLVLDLLVEMGYGGSFSYVEVVGGIGDGGIDGIIYQDKLGLDVIGVQAKRWSDSVGPDKINQFVGALGLKGMKKGIIITTSRFTSGSVEAAENSVNPKISFIDGPQLTKLMIDHNIGVSITNTYKIKQVNLDYFGEEE